MTHLSTRPLFFGINPQISGGDNTAATKEGGEVNHGTGDLTGDPGGHSVWYRWSPPLPGTNTLTFQSFALVGQVGVYVGTGVGALTPITNGQGANFTLQFTNQVDTDYFIAVDAAANAEGSFDLAMTAVGSTNAGHFEFARTAYSFTEEDGTEQIMIRRTTNFTGQMVVSWTTAPGFGNLGAGIQGGVAGTDYVPANGTVTFDEFQMARTIPVTVLSNAVTDTHDFRVLITDVRPQDGCD